MTKYFIALLILVLTPVQVGAHGNVTPTPIETPGLNPLTEWLEANPYHGNERAIAIGAHGYAMNCASCHGLHGKAGSIAPDLRELPETDFGDQWYIQKVREGYTRHGMTKMPAYEGILSQEAMWAIRAYIDSLPEP